ncbi:50S ribosomal protein L11 methyltransferase [Sediminibacillus halophilus]|uniref:Ribosomal protein L11 methyltransferase n=1 Tax=Sediminibacillus halophilus TaxID=482461 RepID=A0A1G9NS10_9BACI|nr:50S ribosomal protein L11 methyltransferase [Sediminibacillus halophilus]SDL89396.1 ribosomal protein L11 methyltransferase [Sediminibacillus halophilus]
MLHEFIVRLATESVDEAIEKLNAFGVYNLYYEPPIEIYQVENGYDYREIEQKYAELKIYAEEDSLPGLPQTYFTRIKQALNVPKEAIRYREVDEQQWNTAFEDIDLENGWVLCYSGSEDKYPNKQVLKFEPQAAFGTGLHETTQDCLRILLSTDLSGQTVLDLGTGSGVLSIAAGLKGAHSLTAVDYEPVEREIRLNAELNNLQQPLQVEKADLLTGDYRIKEHYDLIIINIGAEETRKILDRHLLAEKSSTFLISGIVEWNVESVVADFHEKGFFIKEKRQANEWVTILFEKTA